MELGLEELVGCQAGSDGLEVWDCYNIGLVKGKAKYVGGICGEFGAGYSNSGIAMTNCYNSFLIDSGEAHGQINGLVRGGKVENSIYIFFR